MELELNLKKDYPVLFSTFYRDVIINKSPIKQTICHYTKVTCNHYIKSAFPFPPSTFLSRFHVKPSCKYHQKNL